MMGGGLGGASGGWAGFQGLGGDPQLSPPLLEGMMSLPWALFYLKPALNLKTTNPPI